MGDDTELDTGEDNGDNGTKSPISSSDVREFRFNGVVAENKPSSCARGIKAAFTS